MSNVKQSEYLLAEKAQSILEHQQELESLNDRHKKLQQQKPKTSKDHLSYQESLAFSKEVKQYEAELHSIEISIQKIRRELSALKKQAKKLLPVSDVKVKVSTSSDDDTPSQTYCIKHIKKENGDQSDENFKIERLK